MYESTKILFEQVVTEIHHKIVVTQKVSGNQNAVRKTKWFVLRNESDLGAPLTSVAKRTHNFDPSVANDDSDFGNPGRDHGLDSVKQNGFVGNRHQLFGTGVSDGSQSGASTTSQNEGFHVNKPRGINLVGSDRASILPSDNDSPTVSYVTRWAEDQPCLRNTPKLLQHWRQEPTLLCHQPFLGLLIRNTVAHLLKQVA